MIQKAKENVRFGIYLVLAIMTAVGTVMACGVMVGQTKSELTTLKERQASESAMRESLEGRTALLETKQSFMEGKLTAELEGLRRDMNRMVTFVENLELADGKNSSP